jgi:diguanylate cyclase (GGDEF)-like protein
MLVPAATIPIVLDVTTLFVVATCVSGLLGMLLLIAWAKSRIQALAWWGAAYLIGGLSVAAWSFEGLVAPALPVGIAHALLFVACGMIWNAARVFHGRPVKLGALIAGAATWLFACTFTDFAPWPAARIGLSAVIVAGYTLATAAELARERRKSLRGRWPALFVPMLYGAVFLFPISLVSLLPANVAAALAPGWVALFVLVMTLYAVGTAFIVLVVATERTMRMHRDAAVTDELTGLLNRRGVLQAAQALIARQAQKGQSVGALMFDLDHFKSINDRFGHAIGDQALHLFAVTASASTRATDIVGRFGGEEFVALLPGTIADAKLVAERIRKAFEAVGVTVAGCDLNATVSIGAAAGQPGTDIVALLAAADAALFRAKANGRNRVEAAKDGEMPILFATTYPRTGADREASATRPDPQERDPRAPGLTPEIRFAPRT